MWSWVPCPGVSSVFVRVSILQRRKKQPELALLPKQNYPHGGAPFQWRSHCLQSSPFWIAQPSPLLFSCYWFMMTSLAAVDSIPSKWWWSEQFSKHYCMEQEFCRIVAMWSTTDTQLWFWGVLVDSKLKKGCCDTRFGDSPQTTITSVTNCKFKGPQDYHSEPSHKFRSPQVHLQVQ